MSSSAAPETPHENLSDRSAGDGSAGEAHDKSALHFRDFRLLITGRFCIGMANNMQVVAIGWHIWVMTQSAFALGMVGLTGFLPLLAVALFAGHLIDRFERQRILILCYFALFLSGLAFVLIVFFATPALQIILIYPMVGLNALARAFVNPSYQALTPNVVPRAVLPRAIALSSSVMQFTVACGPALGGIILAFGDILLRPLFYGDNNPNAPENFGNIMVFVAAALLQFIGVLAAAAMRTRSKGSLNRGMSLGLLFSGWDFIRMRRVILRAIGLDMFAVLLGGATALMPIYADQILQVGPLGLGMLRSAPAVGALGIGFYLSKWPLGANAGRVMLWAVGIFGVATVIFGLSTILLVSLLALVVMGGADMFSMYVRQNLVQVGTPDDMRGRVGAVTGIFISTSNEIGEFESGIAAHFLGVVPAVVIGGMGTILCAVIWRLCFRDLSAVDLTKDGQDKLIQQGHMVHKTLLENMSKATIPKSL